jgi:hypothetical protein
VCVITVNLLFEVVLIYIVENVNVTVAVDCGRVGIINQKTGAAILFLLNSSKLLYLFSYL